MQAVKNISKPTTKRVFKTIYMYRSLCIGQYILCTLLFVFSEFVCVPLCVSVLLARLVVHSLGVSCSDVEGMLWYMFREHR